MPFIKDILQHKSVSIVGMAKNTGKTTCLNYVLERLSKENSKVAVTSIGVDGEEKDVLYNTLKPRIRLKAGTYFITSKQHFEERELQADILSVSNKMTALGHLITAQAKSEGRLILSGPSDSIWLHESINSLLNFGVDIVLVDGALSRMSLASPAVTDAMVLCTGAACAIQLEQLTKRVKYLCEMINLPQVELNISQACSNIADGVWAISEQGDIIEKMADSLLTQDKAASEWLAYYKKFFIYGVLTDDFLKILTTKSNLSNIVLVVRDFSRIFVKPATYSKFINRGGKIEVLQHAKLLAVCTNPTSPEGYNYEPEILRSHIENELHLPVFDIVQIMKQGM